MTRAIILAGGKGTRLMPLTITRPKPLIPVVNKPLLEHKVDHLISNNLKDITITTYYLSNQIKSYINNIKNNNNIKIYKEKKPLGTAGALKTLYDNDDETILIASGDGISDCQLEPMIKFHKNKGSVFTIGIKKVSNSTQYGLIDLDSNEQITKYIEKPHLKEPIPGYVNSGIYVIETSILKYFNKNVKTDFSKDIIPKLMSLKENIYGYKINGFWCDIGSPSEYIWAHNQILRNKTKIIIPGKEIKNGIWIGNNVKIGKNVKLKGPILIGDNTVIKDNVSIGPRAILGLNNIIKNNSKVIKSITYNNVIINKNCRIYDSIIGEKVTTGQNINLGSRNIIQDYTKINSNTS